MTSRPIIALFFSLLISASATADLVKPALIEINVYHDGSYKVELRASIEALLTGINAKYKDTSQSPLAAEYDELRRLDPKKLALAFEPFKTQLLKTTSLKFDGKPVVSQISKIDIPERGYTRIPRISVIYLEGKYPENAKQLTWHYPAIFGDHAVRVRQVNQIEESYHWSSWQWIRDNSVSEPFSVTEIANPQSTLDIFQDYVIAGFRHILPLGLDHILFILGLYLFSIRLKPLFWQITLFTIAHTITLGMAMYGLISLPAEVVEPLIALSIAYIGFENIRQHKLASSRLLIIFGFGLLHGLGFASMLADFGMPEDAFVTALISFNIGVELGQLCIIFAAYLIFGIWFKDQTSFKQRIGTPASFAIAAIALYWFWERIDWIAIL